MSVAPDRPEHLHPLRRPAQYGGSGKDPVWALDLTWLSAGLLCRQDSLTHGMIEPATTLLLAEYERRLADTKPFWIKLP